MAIMNAYTTRKSGFQFEVMFVFMALFSLDLRVSNETVPELASRHPKPEDGYRVHRKKL
jgi:hypothetical protein